MARTESLAYYVLVMGACLVPIFVILYASLDPIAQAWVDQPTFMNPDMPVWAYDGQRMVLDIWQNLAVIVTLAGCIAGLIVSRGGA